MKIDAQFLLEHPLPISVVSGVANGLIYKLRGKKVDYKTAATLCAVTGLGEAALVMYEKPEDRGPVLRDMSLLSIGIWSTAGFFLGLIPFMKWDPYMFSPGELSPPASPEPEMVPAQAPVTSPAVAGFGSVPRRRAAPPRRAAKKAPARRR